MSQHAVLDCVFVYLIVMLGNRGGTYGVVSQHAVLDCVFDYLNIMLGNRGACVVGSEHAVYC